MVMKREETIGNRLKKARLKLGLTFDEIYRDLRIHPKILEALEEDRIDPTIGEIYIRGFLKKYGRYLKLQTDEILSEFTEEALFKRGQREEFINIGGGKKTPPLIIKDRFRKSILPLIAIFALLFTISIIGYAGWRLIKEFEKFRPTPSAQSPLVIPENQPLALKVKTKDEVWVRVKSDGKIIFEHILPKDSIENWEAQDKLELWVGRAEALDFTLNDNYLGSPGRGRIRKMIIDRQGLRIEEK